MSESVAKRSSGRSLLPWVATFTFVGLLTALHHHAYRGVEWSVALWWGLKDWYLWGLIALAIIAVIRIIGAKKIGAAGLVAGALAIGLVVVVMHSALAVTMSYFVEYSGSLSWWSLVTSHVLKKAVESSAVFVILAGAAWLLTSRSSTGEDGSAGTDDDESDEAPRRVSRLLLRVNGREELIEIRSIIRIEAEGNYVRVHTAEKKYLERRTLTSLDRMLPEEQFLRIHRSHLVNLDQIDRMEPVVGGTWTVVLHDGTSIPMGRTYRRKIASAIGTTL